jgi:membrane protein
VWVIVLLGAVIAAYAPSLQMRIVLRPPGAGDRFELALAVLARLCDAAPTPAHGLTTLQLAQALRADPLQVDPLLERFVEWGWVVRVDEEGAQRHLLVAGLDTTPAQPLVDALLLQPSAPATAFRRRAGVEAMTLRELLG